MAKKKMTCGPKAGLVRKLDPSRLRVSHKFHAILGCLLGQEWTTPLLTALCVTRDGHVLGEKEGQPGFNADFRGPKLTYNLNAPAPIPWRSGSAHCR